MERCLVAAVFLVISCPLDGEARRSVEDLVEAFGSNGGPLIRNTGYMKGNNNGGIFVQGRPFRTVPNVRKGERQMIINDGTFIGDEDIGNIGGERGKIINDGNFNGAGNIGNIWGGRGKILNNGNFIGAGNIGNIGQAHFGEDINIPGLVGGKRVLSKSSSSSSSSSLDVSHRRGRRAHGLSRGLREVIHQAKQDVQGASVINNDGYFIGNGLGGFVDGVVNGGRITISESTTKFYDGTCKLVVVVRGDGVKDQFEEKCLHKKARKIQTNGFAFYGDVFTWSFGIYNNFPATLVIIREGKCEKREYKDVGVEIKGKIANPPTGVECERIKREVEEQMDISEWNWRVYKHNAVKQNQVHQSQMGVSATVNPPTPPPTPPPSVPTYSPIPMRPSTPPSTEDAQKIDQLNKKDGRKESMKEPPTTRLRQLIWNLYSKAHMTISSLFK